MIRSAFALALLLAAAPALAESGQSGVWTYTFEPSSTGSGGIMTALSPAPSPSGDPNDPAYLIARCLGGRTELMVGGSGGWGLPRRKLEVTTQIDGATPETALWAVSSNGKAVFLDEGVEAFMRKLPDSGKLRIAVKSGAGGVHEGVFATTGFGEVRAKIAQVCGWTP
jgi:hypothetical protein